MILTLFFLSYLSSWQLQTTYTTTTQLITQVKRLSINALLVCSTACSPHGTHDLHMTSRALLSRWADWYCVYACVRCVHRVQQMSQSKVVLHAGSSQLTNHNAEFIAGVTYWQPYW